MGILIGMGDAGAGIIDLDDDYIITWNISAGDMARVTIAGDRDLAILNPTAGRYYTLLVHQDGSGNRTLTLPPNSVVLNGTTMSADPHTLSILVALYDGDTYYWAIAKEVEE